MARNTPQLNRSSSTSSRNSRQPSSSSDNVPTRSGNRNNNNNNNGASSSGEDKKIAAPIIPGFVMFPLVMIYSLYCLLKMPFSGLLSLLTPTRSSRRELSDEEEDEQSNIVSVDPPTVTDNDDPDVIRAELAKHAEDNDYLTVAASPALTTLLDDALYKAYQAELLPTVSAASQLLAEFIEMKESAALILKECRWMVGVPMGGGMNIRKWDTDAGKVLEIAIGHRGPFGDGQGIVIGKHGTPALGIAGDGSNSSPAGTNAAAERWHSEEMTKWNEFDTIQDFARQCYLGANEAIQRLTTDRLAESANLTLQDSMAAFGSQEGEKNGGGQGGSDGSLQQSSQTQSSVNSAPAGSSAFLSPADAGIGRCYHPQPRRDTWESPRLYCPDYYWADDAIGGCQRLLKTLSKHRFVSLVSANGWERYGNSAGTSKYGVPKASSTFLRPPTYASCTPHVFPSLEALHALQHLTSNLLPHSIPSSLNQFRAAAESNAVVSKRLYLVKCEYRAPMRALWESYQNLNSAPKGEVVERYLREYHGVKIGENKGVSSDGAGSVSSDGGSTTSTKSSGLRRKGSTEVTKKQAEGAKKSAIQLQREKLETLIREKYWKHPAFVEALQLERCCEQLEFEMSQMLLPLSNLAVEIMTEWKGRIRAVAVANPPGHDEEENNDDDDSSDDDEILEPMRVLLGWQDVPYMRELLRRLKSILRRKPDLDESTGIRPLLLDLQGVPRHKQDPIDSSIEMPFYPPSSSKPSLFDRFTSENSGDISSDDEWFHLEQFLLEVGKLLELLNLPNIPCLVEERVAGSDKSTLQDLIEQCNEVWDEEMFRAQYQDWYDMVKRQQELNAGTANAGSANNNTTLSELSETIREAEIELSIAMASKDQLERVHKRLEALRADKKARYKVLRHIVFDLGYRELNDGIVVEPPSDDATVEFPKLSEAGVFGDQLILSGEEFLPVG